jgi:CTP:molybdopterin cytidylyltransferase MocA/phosphoglycolate phosphatase-like HAD superfamily hydrolase
MAATERHAPARPATIAILALEGVLLELPGGAAVDPGQARRRPGAAALLDHLERARIRLALCTDLARSAALAALAAAGLDPGRFFHIEAAPRDDDGSGDGAAAPPPSGAAIERIVAAARQGASSAPERVFFLAARPVDVAAAVLAQAALGSRVTVIPVALRSAHVPDQELDQPGFALLVDTLDQAGALVTTPPLPCSLGLVLLAYDEEASIAAAIADARRFASLYFTGHEIVVVDDGSRDATAAAATACDQGDVRLVRHAENQGMGASMRDGYAAARADLLVPLPGDRQVRPSTLIQFVLAIDPADPMRVVIGAYSTPHAGPTRQVMSIVFRLLVRYVGGYRVDVAGAYMFHRSLLERLDARRTRSQSFLYSFQLLEQMRRLGCRFARVTIRSFAREVGQSREATLRRIARMFVEIARSRLESAL